MKDIERMVVSAHEDGEVESPWKQRVEKRLADDAEWAAEAALHQLVKAKLASSPEPDFAGAQARVGAKLRSLTDALPHSRSLPLAWVSVAAAALLIVSAGTGYWLGRQSSAVGVQVSELQVKVPKQLELKLSGEGQLLMASTLEGSRR